MRKLDELASRAGPPLGVPSADLPDAIRRNPDYVERRVYGVGILFLGGPFRLDLDPNAARSLAMDRPRFDLSPDPFAGNADLALTGIYATEAQAFAAVKSSGFQRPGYVVYTHYRGAENIIFPTIMSATTTPALISGASVGRQRRGRLRSRCVQDPAPGVLHIGGTSLCAGRRRCRGAG